MNKPQTPAEFAAYRCQASCKTGRNVLNGEMVEHFATSGKGRIEYAVFNLLHAVEDLSKQVELLSKQSQRIEALEAVIRKTINDNGNLADGENCTLADLKRVTGIE